MADFDIAGSLKDPPKTAPPSTLEKLFQTLNVLSGVGYPVAQVPIEGRPIQYEPLDAITRAAPVVQPLPVAAPAPVVSPAVAPAVSAPAMVAAPSIADIKPEIVPAVAAPTTRSIEELQSIASILSPQVEAQPLTREQLVGGDVLGLTPEQVHNVTATRTAQLATKATTDKQALDFLQKSTGLDTAKKLVAEKIQEEGAASRAEFIAGTASAEAAKARNRSILMEQWKAKTSLANKLLVANAEAAAKAAGGGNLADIWKNKKAAILTEFSNTNPLAAAGLTRIPDIDDALTKLEADKAIPADSNLKMTEEEHNFYSKIVSLGVPPTDTDLEEVF